MGQAGPDPVLSHARRALPLLHRGRVAPRASTGGAAGCRADLAGCPDADLGPGAGRRVGSLAGCASGQAPGAAAAA